MKRVVDLALTPPPGETTHWTGRMLAKAAGVSLLQGDVLDVRKLTQAMAGCDVVFHFAANADVRYGLQHPRKNLEQNTVATLNVREAMRVSWRTFLSFSSIHQGLEHSAGPKLSIREGVERTISWLNQNRWILNRRK